MADKLRLVVVTPDNIFYDNDVDMVIFRSTEGDRGILKNHRPLVAGVKAGDMRIKINGQFTEAKISEGFINVTKEKAVILTESARWA
ncbi:MAG: hypothetical protein LBR30_05230 [Clostridioides sp.]|jgi:F-type H+-transporting ATPase subunit epsilon|nr:hypothetical protein [Clostridioides sp.]